MFLTYDATDDRRSNEQKIEKPDWSAVEQAIRRLDARRYTEVTLGNGSYMSVSGGDGQYYVFIFTQDERNLVLKKTPSLPGEILLMSGGQTARLPATHVVELLEALQAARTYYESTVPDPRMDWVEA
jgi:hypothetical protein